MTSVTSFLAFHVFWLVAVGGAARGLPWAGLLALPVLLAVHARLVPADERRRELAFAVAVGVLGGALDSALKWLAVTRYPSSEGVWTWTVVPPFIAGLWAAFATLPRFSLRWLVGRPALAALLGAVGGPLSFAAGVRLGAVGVGPTPALTWGVLALEYALATPLLLRLAPGARPVAPAPIARAELPG
jgi:hypothetical protein